MLPRVRPSGRCKDPDVMRQGLTVHHCEMLRRLMLPSVVCVMLAGCGGNEGHAASEPAVSESPSVNLSTLTLPIDAYRPDPEQDLKIRQAHALLFARCMAEFGFRVGGPRPTEIDRDRNRERYMLANAAAARTHGYHPAERPLVPSAAQGPARPPDYLTAASGQGPSSVKGKPVPRGGCNGDAVRTLGGGTDPAARGVVEEIRRWSWSRSQQDSRVVAVFASWSACMKRQGYWYRTPLHANDDPAWSGAAVTQRELATAVADVRCKQETRVIAVWAAIERAYQQRAIAERSGELRGVKETVRTQVRVATDVLAAS